MVSPCMPCQSQRTWQPGHSSDLHRWFLARQSRSCAGLHDRYTAAHCDEPRSEGSCRTYLMIRTCAIMAGKLLPSLEQVSLPLDLKNSANTAALVFESSPPQTMRPSSLSSCATSAAFCRSSTFSIFPLPLPIMWKPPWLRNTACKPPTLFT